MHAGLGVGVGKFGQIWAKVGSSGWIRLIGRGLVIWPVGGCRYVLPAGRFVSLRQVVHKLKF